MKFNEALEKIKTDGSVKINDGNIWLIKLPDGETMLGISGSSYHSSRIIKVENSLEKDLRFLLNKAETDTEGNISISNNEIRM